MTIAAEAQPFPNAALFEQLGIEDPRLLQLAHLMSQGSASRTGEEDEEKGETIEMVRSERLDALQDEIDRLKGINRILYEQCEHMAAAIGACPLCWGEDPECRECGGRGTPGAFLPHRASFAELVLPAIDRVRDFRRNCPPRRADAGDEPTGQPAA